ncbi:MAG: thioredoxin domain-containing protein [Candidatus Saccharibacteria bacterium]|nr:thioredoxin domain-containing protein [Candidatus Saccharibacteria bacterium]
MKKHTGFSKVGLVACLIMLALVGLTIFLVTEKDAKVSKFREFTTKVAGPLEENGYIGDHIEGPTDAPVLIFEYSDFQCGYCALMSTQIKDIINAAEGNLAIVHRSFLLSYHQNGTAAASAAEAAGLQGYYEAYSDELFNRQDEWAYASASERTAMFLQYFKNVTDEKGDEIKFLDDLNSANVSKKINFDIKLAQLVDVSATPSFYIDGKLIDFGNKNGGEITINDETFSWDSPLTSDEFKQLILNIVNASLESK